MDKKLDEKLDIENMENKPYKVGRVTKAIIDEFGLPISEKDILIWGDRIPHIERHKGDFATEEDYKKHIEAMPDIISNPDYVSIHPNGQSLEYIKRIDELVLVAVRIKLKGNLVVRSAYPIKEEKLDSYITSGRARIIKD